MGVKEYLQQIRLLDAKINIKLAEKQAWYDMLHSMDYSKDKVQGGVAGSTVENCVIKIEMIEKELDESIDKLVNIKREAIRMIDEGIEDSLQYQILYMRYFQFKGFGRIAKELNYTEQWVIKQHGLALLRLKEFSKV